MRILGPLAVATLLVVPAVQAQTVYRCVRADGSVYLGQERPSPGACVQQSTSQWESGPAPAAAPGTTARPDGASAPPPAGTPTGRYGLWERREGTGPWRDAASLGSQELCQVERDRRTETAKNRLVDAVVEEPGTVRLRAENNREYVRYQCLPEGTRPS